MKPTITAAQQWSQRLLEVVPTKSEKSLPRWSTAVSDVRRRAWVDIQHPDSGNDRTIEITIPKD